MVITSAVDTSDEDIFFQQKKMIFKVFFFLQLAVFIIARDQTILLIESSMVLRPSAVSLRDEEIQFCRFAARRQISIDVLLERVPIRMASRVAQEVARMLPGCHIRKVLACEKQFLPVICFDAFVIIAVFNF